MRCLTVILAIIVLASQIFAISLPPISPARGGDIYLEGNQEMVVENKILEINGSIYMSDNAVLILRNSTLRLVGRNRVILLDNSGTVGRPKIVAVNSTIILEDGTLEARMRSKIFLDNSTISTPVKLLGEATVISLNSTIASLDASGRPLIQAHSSTLYEVRLSGNAIAEVNNSNVGELQVEKAPSLEIYASRIKYLWTNHTSTIGIYDSWIEQLFSFNGNLTLSNITVTLATLNRSRTVIIDSMIQKLTAASLNMSMSGSAVDVLILLGNLNATIVDSDVSILSSQLSENSTVTLYRLNLINASISGPGRIFINNSSLSNLLVDVDSAVRIFNSSISGALTVQLENSTARLSGVKPGVYEDWSLRRGFRILGGFAPDLHLYGVMVGNWSVLCVNTELHVENSSLDRIVLDGVSKIEMSLAKVDEILLNGSSDMKVYVSSLRVVQLEGLSKLLLEDSNASTIILRDSSYAYLKGGAIGKVVLEGRASLIAFKGEIRALLLSIFTVGGGEVVFRDVAPGNVTTFVGGDQTPSFLLKSVVIEAFEIELMGFTEARVAGSLLRRVELYNSSKIAVRDSQIESLAVRDGGVANIDNSTVGSIAVDGMARLTARGSRIGTIVCRETGSIGILKTRVKNVMVVSGRVEVVDSIVDSYVVRGGRMDFYRNVSLAVFRPDASPLPFRARIKSRLTDMGVDGPSGSTTFKLLYRTVLKDGVVEASNFTVEITPLECPKCIATMGYSVRDGLERAAFTYRYEWFNLTLDVLIESKKAVLGKPLKLKVVLNRSMPAPLSGVLYVYMDGALVYEEEIRTDRLSLTLWPVRNGTVHVTAIFKDSPWFRECKGHTTISVGLLKEPVIVTETETIAATKTIYLTDVDAIIASTTIIMLILVMSVLIYYGLKLIRFA